MILQSWNKVKVIKLIKLSTIIQTNLTQHQKKIPRVRSVLQPAGQTLALHRMIDANFFFTLEKKKPHTQSSSCTSKKWSQADRLPCREICVDNTHRIQRQCFKSSTFSMTAEAQHPEHLLENNLIQLIDTRILHTAPSRTHTHTHRVAKKCETPWPWWKKTPKSRKPVLRESLSFVSSSFTRKCRQSLQCGLKYVDLSQRSLRWSNTTNFLDQDGIGMPIATNCV